MIGREDARKMYRLATLFFVAGLSACATNLQQNVIKPDPATAARLEKYTSVEAVQLAEETIKKTKEKDLHFYAPEHFNIASQAIAEARNLLASNQPREKIVDKVAVAETVMQNGDLMMRKVKAVLNDELTLKQNLDSLNASKIYSGEYGSLIQRLETIIRQVENGKLNDVTDSRAKLKKEMGELQARTIRYNALNEAEEILKRVTYSGGPKLAPFAYEEATTVLKRADEFITRNPYAAESVEKIGREALFAAKRALYVTQEVAALSTKVNTSLEQVVLDEEYRIARIARALNIADVRDNPLEVQSERLAKSVSELHDQSRKQEDLVVALRDTLIKVRDSAAAVSTNPVIKQLKKEKSEWLAKEALYSAKLGQLTAELKQKDDELNQIKTGVALVGRPGSAVSSAKTEAASIDASMNSRQSNDRAPLGEPKKIDIAVPANEHAPTETLETVQAPEDDISKRVDQALEMSAPAAAPLVAQETPVSVEPPNEQAVLHAIENSTTTEAVTGEVADSVSETANPREIHEMQQPEVTEGVAAQVKSFADSDR